MDPAGCGVYWKAPGFPINPLFLSGDRFNRSSCEEKKQISYPQLQLCMPLDWKWIGRYSLFSIPVLHSGYPTMNEHSFIRSIHAKLPSDVYAWKINDNFQGGVADAYYSRRNGKDMWIEYKYLKGLPKRSGTRIQIGLSELQKAWLESRVLDGRTVSVIVGSPDGALILTDGNWNTPVTACSFIRNAVETPAIVAYILSTLSKDT